MSIIGIDHVQIAMPVGAEDEARAFYAGVLGMTEVEKPQALAVRGGCWFNGGSAAIHLGREVDFRPARRAHPALRISGFDAFCARLMAAGITVTADDELPGVRRANIHDPFGNRIELVSAD